MCVFTQWARERSHWCQVLNLIQESTSELVLAKGPSTAKCPGCRQVQVMTVPIKTERPGGVPHVERLRVGVENNSQTTGCSAFRLKTRIPVVRDPTSTKGTSSSSIWG